MEVHNGRIAQLSILLTVFGHRVRWELIYSHNFWDAGNVGRTKLPACLTGSFPPKNGISALLDYLYQRVSSRDVVT